MKDKTIGSFRTRIKELWSFKIEEIFCTSEIRWKDKG